MQEKFDNASKEEQWMMQYSQLKKFYEKHGHSKVPARYLKDMTLGEWVRTQRKMWKVSYSLKAKYNMVYALASFCDTANASLYNILLLSFFLRIH